MNKPNKKRRYEVKRQIVRKKKRLVLLHDKIKSRKQRRQGQNRTSQSPSFIALHVGIPIGQPNSTVLTSAPIIFLSSLLKLKSHSLTGSAPESVAKKTA